MSRQCTGDCIETVVSVCMVRCPAGQSRAMSDSARSSYKAAAVFLAFCRQLCVAACSSAGHLIDWLSVYLSGVSAARHLSNYSRRGAGRRA